MIEQAIRAAIAAAQADLDTRANPGDAVAEVEAQRQRARAAELATWVAGRRSRLQRIFRGESAATVYADAPDFDETASARTQQLLDIDVKSVS